MIKLENNNNKNQIIILIILNNLIIPHALQENNPQELLNIV